MRRVGLPDNIKGKLFLHSMPGTKESWSDFVSQIQEEGVEQIVSLTSLKEIQNQSPDYADSILNKTLSINWIELPIKDFSIPRDANSFKQCIKKIANFLIKGKAILIHCFGGIGRTGLAACCVLQILGLEQNDAQERVKQSGSSPETQEQRNFIHDWV